MIEKLESITPKEFTVRRPTDSKLKNFEHETVAAYIMSFLAENGNTWRELCFKEYKKYRLSSKGQAIYATIYLSNLKLELLWTN